MRKHSFPHGLHPAADGKALTAEKTIQAFRPTGECVYPLNQHIGAPAEPVVQVGDPVQVGQTLARPTAFLSAAICSGASGRVKAIEPRLTAEGKKRLSIVVDNDGRFEPLAELGQWRDPAAMSAGEILAAIRAAGVVGQGGAGFPTDVKLTVKRKEPDTVIINAAECEPYLTSDYRMLLEYPDRLLEGIGVLLRLFPKAQAVIAVEDNKPRAISVLRAKIDSPRIRVMPLKTKYPQGGERMLVYAVTGRRLHSGRLPVEAGCLVLNVSTTASVAWAVCHRTPQIRTVVTVTGEAVARPGNWMVPVGSSWHELLEAAGGLRCPAQKLVAGGPMMGVSLETAEVPVVKTSSALVALEKDEAALWEPTACIRCGRCVRACPELLVPVEMARAADRFDLVAFERLGGMECIGCGCCTYVCPAKRRLTQSFLYARKAIAAARKSEKTEGEGGTE